MDLLERMPLAHQDMFKRMLRSELIPQELVLEYFAHRVIADRADIAICSTLLVQLVARYQGVEVTDVEKYRGLKTAPEKPKTIDDATDAERVAKSPIKSVEETSGGIIPNEPTHEAPIETPEPELAEAEFADGQEVEVFEGNEILTGTIAGRTSKGKYQIRVEGKPELVEANVKDIEAV